MTDKQWRALERSTRLLRSFLAVERYLAEVQGKGFGETIKTLEIQIAKNTAILEQAHHDQH